MDDEARRIAADLISEEFSEFEQFPRQYAESAGWDPSRVRAGVELDYTERELRALTAMIEEFLEEGMDYSGIIEQSEVQGYLSDLVAEKGLKPGTRRGSAKRRLAMANPKQFQREDFTYTANRDGYMIYYKNRPIGGAGVTLPRETPLRGKQAWKNVKDFTSYARMAIDDILAGRGEERFLSAISGIDGPTARGNPSPPRKGMLDEAALDLVYHVPRNEWGERIDSLKEGSTAGENLIQAIEGYASNLSQIAAELSFYLLMRGGGITGDHGHEEAMAYAQKRLRAVRKALGYSYP